MLLVDPPVRFAGADRVVHPGGWQRSGAAAQRCRGVEDAVPYNRFNVPARGRTESSAPTDTPRCKNASPGEAGGCVSVSINPRPCHSEPVTDVTGVGIRNLLAGNLRKSAGLMRLGNGLPRQSADWLAMTGYFDRLTHPPAKPGDASVIISPDTALCRRGTSRSSPAFPPPRRARACSARAHRRPA